MLDLTTWRLSSSCCIEVVYCCSWALKGGDFVWGRSVLYCVPSSRAMILDVCAHVVPT